MPVNPHNLEDRLLHGWTNGKKLHQSDASTTRTIGYIISGHLIQNFLAHHKISNRLDEYEQINRNRFFGYGSIQMVAQLNNLDPLPKCNQEGFAEHICSCQVWLFPLSFPQLHMVSANMCTKSNGGIRWIQNG